MKPFYQQLNFRALPLGLLAVLVLASCSSYQYTGYESDGIYSSEARKAVASEQPEESYNKADYYAQQIDQYEQELEYIQETNPIFTDVDEYSSEAYNAEAYGTMNEQSSYGGWGDEADEVVINIYANPHYHTGYHDPYFPYNRYSPYYGPIFGAGYGYGGYGYGFGYGYGYHSGWSWRMRMGIFNEWTTAGFGYGISPYAGYYGMYGGYYGNPYSARNVAYNNSRRNSFVDYSSNARGDGNYSSRSSSRINNDYSNSRNVRASGRSNDYSVSRTTRSSERTYSTRTTRVDRPTTTRSNNSTYRRPVNRSSNNARVRSNTSNTRSVPQVRSSAPTRNSGTVRSTRSSNTRSTGGGSSSSRSSRGRGN